MAKANFGQYTAFHTNGGIRFMQDSKLTSEAKLPVEVVAYLKKSLGETQEQIAPAITNFAMPTEEEKRQLLADSLIVKPELQAEPDEIAAPAAPVAPVDTDFIESVSIHTASLQDIAQALLERFGIYSIYLGTLPSMDEINPLTGEMFTKYHLGIAYQAAIRGQNTGLLSRPAEFNRKVIDEGRYASANLPLDVPAATMGQARRENSYEFRTSPQGNDAKPQTEIIHVTGDDGIVRAEQRVIPEGETGHFNGASARYDKEEDEVLVQPNFSGKPVIRPNW